MILDIKKHGMVPYVAPFVFYLLLSQIAASFDRYYVELYIASALIVTGVAVYLLRGRDLLRGHKKIGPGVMVGVVGIVIWILLSRSNLDEMVISALPAWLQPEPRLGFNPFTEISNPATIGLFLFVRTASLTILVPVVEELFWRGFLLRWVISESWETQKNGIFTLRSFFWVVLLFTLAHPEWFAAAIYCALLNLLLYWKKDLWLCFIAHGTSNFLLVVYILMTGSWELW